jgi:WD40 repeat protein
MGKTVRLWDPTSGECRQAFEGHANWVGGVAVSAKGSLLASASHDKPCISRATADVPSPGEDRRVSGCR